MKLPSGLNTSPGGVLPTTLKVEPGGRLSLLPTLPLTGWPAGVDTTSATGTGVSTRVIEALAQLTGAAASQTW
mgnify:CR=1 FL=1